MKLKILILGAMLFNLGTGYASDLSEKGMRVYENALKDSTYEVNWSEFNFKDPKEDEEASKVFHKLDDKFSEIISQIIKSKSLVSNQTNDLEKETYKQLNAVHQIYIHLQNKTSENWSNAFMDGHQ